MVDICKSINLYYLDFSFVTLGKQMRGLGLLGVPVQMSLPVQGNYL